MCRNESTRRAGKSTAGRRRSIGSKYATSRPTSGVAIEPTPVLLTASPWDDVDQLLHLRRIHDSLAAALARPPAHRDPVPSHRRQLANFREPNLASQADSPLRYAATLAHLPH